MEREQVIQNLYRLYEISGIFDKQIQMALNLAILELAGEGKAETPPKVRAVFDKMHKDMIKLKQTGRGQRVLAVEDDGG